MSNIGYSIHEALRHFRRNWSTVFGAIVTIFLSLFIIGAFLTGCVIAAATEVGQYYTGYRSADSLDFFADALAMAICSLLVFILDISKQK